MDHSLRFPHRLYKGPNSCNPFLAWTYNRFSCQLKGARLKSNSYEVYMTKRRRETKPSTFSGPLGLLVELIQPYLRNEIQRRSIPRKKEFMCATKKYCCPKCGHIVDELQAVHTADYPFTRILYMELIKPYKTLCPDGNFVEVSNVERLLERLVRANCRRIENYWCRPCHDTYDENRWSRKHPFYKVKLESGNKEISYLTKAEVAFYVLQYLITHGKVVRSQLEQLRISDARKAVRLYPGKLQQAQICSDLKRTYPRDRKITGRYFVSLPIIHRGFTYVVSNQIKGDKHAAQWLRQFGDSLDKVKKLRV